MTNIETMLNEVLQHMTRKMPEPAPEPVPNLPAPSQSLDLPGSSQSRDLPGPSQSLDLPGPSQSLDLLGQSLDASLSVTEEDLQSMISGYIASSPFQSPTFVSPSMPAQFNPPFFPAGLTQSTIRPRSLSVPPLLDKSTAMLKSPPPSFVPTLPPNPVSALPQDQMAIIPPSPIPTMPPVMPPFELPLLSGDGQSASVPTFLPEPVLQVLLETERFFTDKDLGRVAIALAKRCFFGEAALAAATLYGKGGTKQKLAGQKLQDLRRVLEQTPPFRSKTASEQEHLWKQCLKAIANSCKELRKKEIAKADVDKN